MYKNDRVTRCYGTLAKKDVRNTLKEIKENTAPGSILIADFYAKQFVNGDMFPGKKKSLDQLKMTNEELGFGVTFEGTKSQELKSLIEGEKMKLGEVYYMGYQTKKSTWMAVAEIII